MRSCLSLLIILFMASLALAQSGMVSYEQISIGVDAPVKSIAASTLQPSGVAPPMRCLVRVESTSVRYRLDGTAATSSLGTPLLPADEPLVLSIQDATRMSLQGNVSSKTALVDIHCGQ